jgi:hypothetical protein
LKKLNPLRFPKTSKVLQAPSFIKSFEVEKKTSKDQTTFEVYKNLEGFFSAFLEEFKSFEVKKRPQRI